MASVELSFRVQMEQLVRPYNSCVKYFPARMVFDPVSESQQGINSGALILWYMDFKSTRLDNKCTFRFPCHCSFPYTPFKLIQFNEVHFSLLLHFSHTVGKLLSAHMEANNEPHFRLTPVVSHTIAMFRSQIEAPRLLTRWTLTSPGMPALTTHAFGFFQKREKQHAKFYAQEMNIEVLNIL